MDKHIVEAIKRSLHKKKQAALQQTQQQPSQAAHPRHLFRPGELEKERHLQHASTGG
jgi:hypothetical protein